MGRYNCGVGEIFFINRVKIELGCVVKNHSLLWLVIVVEFVVMVTVAP